MTYKVKPYGYAICVEYKKRGVPCNYMYSAKEAKIKTNEVISRAKTNQLNEIQLAIDEAINNGDFYITKDGSLRKETKEALVNMGYSVTTGTQYNESYYTISWR